MSLFKGLTLSSETLSAVRLAPLDAARKRLGDALQVQRKLALNLLDGDKNALPTRRVVVKDDDGNPVKDEAGKTKRINVPVQERGTWYKQAADGSYKFQVRFGNKPMKIEKGNDTITCKTPEQLVAAIDAVIAAAKAKHFDKQLDEIGEVIRKRFAGRKRGSRK